MPRFLDGISYYDTSGTLRTVAPMFQHNIVMRDNSVGYYAIFSLVNNDETSYLNDTMPEMAQRLADAGFTGGIAPCVPASGCYSDNRLIFGVGAMRGVGGGYRMLLLLGSLDFDSGTISTTLLPLDTGLTVLTDTIVEI